MWKAWFIWVVFKQFYMFWGGGKICCSSSFICFGWWKDLAYLGGIQAVYMFWMLEGWAYLGGVQAVLYVLGDGNISLFG